MDLFTTLGFRWARDAVPATLPTHSRERVCFRFHRMLPEFVWDASMLEGNPFTFPEVKTLLDGVTVGGRRLTDQDQVLNLAESSRHVRIQGVGPSPGLTAPHDRPCKPPPVVVKPTPR